MRSCVDRLLVVAALFLPTSAPAADRPTGNGLVADGGIQVRSSELDELVGNKLIAVRTEEYDIRRRVLEEHIAAVLLEREARARKLTVAELTRQEVDGRIRPVTTEEVRAVYDSTRDRFGSQGEAAARAQIETGMLRQRQGKRRAEFIRELKAKADVRLLLEPPRIPVGVVSGPSRGPAKAPVTIVEYADYQCPYCAMLVSTFKQIEEKYSGRVRVVFRDYPLPYHAQAPKAAEAAHCAGEQGEFWKMHDSLYLNQKSLGVADLKRLSGELGLDAEKFGECVDSGRHADTWRKSAKEGEAMGVKYTPTVFVNGRMVSGAQPFEVFDEIVVDELQRVP